MLKIRRPLGRLIFNMGIAIPGKTVFLIETAPRSLCSLDTKPPSTYLSSPLAPQSPLITSLYTSIYGGQLIEADQPQAWSCHDMETLSLCTGPLWGESIADCHGSKPVGELLLCKCLLHHMGTISNAATLKWKDCQPNCHLRCQDLSVWQNSVYPLITRLSIVKLSVSISECPD